MHIFSIKINFVLAFIYYYVKLIHLFKNMRYKIHFSAFTLLCPWTASISQSHMCTSSWSLEFRVTVNISHPCTPNQPSPGYPLKATQPPPNCHILRPLSFRPHASHHPPGSELTLCVSLTSLHPGEGSSKDG